MPYNFYLLEKYEYQSKEVEFLKTKRIDTLFFCFRTTGMVQAIFIPRSTLPKFYLHTFLFKVHLFTNRFFHNFCFLREIVCAKSISGHVYVGPSTMSNKNIPLQQYNH